MSKALMQLTWFLTPTSLILGLALSTAFIFIGRTLGCEGERRYFSIGLIVAALIYLGFAVAVANPLWIFVEAVGVVIFTSLAILGLKKLPWLLVLGWAIHPVWDTALHIVGEGEKFVPIWYPVSCISFDFLVAIYLAVRNRIFAEEKAYSKSDNSAS